MTFYNKNGQLNLFNQPIEVMIEIGCTVKRAAELLKRSETCIYKQISQNQVYQREVSTGKWRVYSNSKTDGTIKVDVAFVYSPTEQHWGVA